MCHRAPEARARLEEEGVDVDAFVLALRHKIAAGHKAEADMIADRLWEKVSVDLVPGRIPDSRVLHERANDELVKLLLDRPSIEAVRVMQSVVRSLRERIPT